MAKAAILLINDCEECPYIDYERATDQPYCCIDTPTQREIYTDEIPDWCPLVVLNGKEEVRSRNLLNAIELEEYMQKEEEKNE